MSLTLGITIGDRIKQAEKLPTNGSIEYMTKIKKLRNVLVGFADAQMVNWRIIPYENTFITALPDTGTQITLDDALVSIYAEFINEQSSRENIHIDEADLYSKIIEADMAAVEAAMQREIGSSEPEE